MMWDDDDEAFVTIAHSDLNLEKVHQENLFVRISNNSHSDYNNGI